MELRRKNSGKDIEKLRAELKEASDQISVAAKDSKLSRQKVAQAKEERDTYNTELQQLTKEKTKLELSISDLNDEVSGDNKSKVGAT